MLLHKVFDQEWLRHKFSPLLAETDSSPMYKAFLHTHVYQGQARTFQWRAVLGRMEYPVQLERSGDLQLSTAKGGMKWQVKPFVKTIRRKRLWVTGLDLFLFHRQ